MSKVRELIQDKKTIYFFDVDGVLAPIEYGEYNHYMLDDDEWAQALLEENFYRDKKPFKVFQNFINERDREHIYVITKVMNEVELQQKKEFLKINYDVDEAHVYGVYTDEQKLDVMKKVKQEYPDLEDHYFLMIDDSLIVLNHIMEHSCFATLHVSSFLE